MIPDTAGPGASPVGILPVNEVELVIIAKRTVSISDHFPVDKILRLHNRNARRHVHGGAGHIPDVPDTYY